MPRLFLFTNGLLPDLAAARRLIQPGDILYAADGGTHHILALGLLPALVVGDMDSLSKDEWELLQAKGVEVQLFPRDKDQTDLELALQLAIKAGHHSIRIVGALGGRLDHTLGNLALLHDPHFSTYDIRLDDGVEEAFYIRSEALIYGKPGELVSLLPWDGDAVGVSTQGLRWSLNTETLYAEKTRGISNEMTSDTASISLKSGCLLILHHR